MKIRALPAVLTAAVLLAGCAASTTPVPPCCYAGSVLTTRLEALAVTLEDGRVVGFADAFPGFTPQQGLLLRTLPLREVLREDIDYATLRPLLPLYDANGDGRLEPPEVLVLYAREAARALGTRIEHFGAGAPVWAVAAPTADIGGLVGWAQQRRGQMSDEGQAVFRDLERLGRDLRVRGSEGGDDQDAVVVF